MLKKHEKIKNLRGEKSLKVPFIIYVDLECLLKKMRSCKNSPKNSYTEKKLGTNLQAMHGVQYARLMIQKNRHCFYRGKDCIEKYCKDLKELETEIINFEENDTINK